MSKIETDWDKGWVAGVAWAAGFMLQGHNEDVYAEHIVEYSGLDNADFKHAASCDLRYMRQSEKLRKFLRGVRGR